MSKIYNLENGIFGKLTVLNKTINEKNKKSATYWDCLCTCGNHTVQPTSSLISGKSTMCWDYAHKITGNHKRKNLIGQRFGKLIVKEMIYDNTKRTKCKCLCDCGNVVIRGRDSLNRNINSSCGCAKKENMKAIRGIEVAGMKFGRLTIFETLWNENPVKVKCKCDCGNIVTCIKGDVTSGHTKSCGCLQSEMASISNEKDWTNITTEYNVKLLNKYQKNKYGQWLWECSCGECGKHFYELPARLNNGHVTSCGCRNKSSKEEFISGILNSEQIDYKEQFSFDDCTYKYKLKFDFAIFKDEKLFCLIEYDGKQHYEPVELFGGEKQFKISKKRDLIKDEYCSVNNIRLVRLPYYLKDNEIKEIITNIINP